MPSCFLERWIMRQAFHVELTNSKLQWIFEIYLPDIGISCDVICKRIRNVNDSFGHSQQYKYVRNTDDAYVNIICFIEFQWMVADSLLLKSIEFYESY